MANNGSGDFLGTARITYTGGKPEAESIFTVVLFKGGKEVATLQGQSNPVKQQDAAAVQLAFSDPWVEGPYTYEFRTEL